MDEAFGRCLGHEGGALANEISALTRETPGGSLGPPMIGRTQREKTAIHEPGSQFPQPAGTLILDVQPPDCEKVNFCLRTAYVLSLWPLEQTNAQIVLMCCSRASYHLVNILSSHANTLSYIKSPLSFS